jgi:hypothetical protein
MRRMRLNTMQSMSTSSFLNLCVVFVFVCVITFFCVTVFPSSSSSLEIMPSMLFRRSGIPRVCIAPLPSMFTSWYQSLAEKKTGIEASDGLGNPFSPLNPHIRKTHYSSGPFLFLSRLLASPLRTDDCANADVVFVPFCPACTILANVEDNLPVGPDISDHNLYLHLFGNTTLLPWLGKKPHWIELGRPSYDFSQWTHMLRHPGAQQFVMTALEVWPVNYPNLVVLPYPSQSHFSEGFRSDVNMTAKNLLVFCTWANRFPLRISLARQCQDRSKLCIFYDAKNWAEPYDNMYMREMNTKAIFCASPHGDTMLRSAFWESIILGCINVLFEQNTPLPFAHILDWGKLVLYIDGTKEEYLNGTKNFVDVLSKVSKEDIWEKQAAILQVRHVFQHSLVPNWNTVTWSLLEHMTHVDDATTFSVKTVFLQAKKLKMFHF